MTDAKEETRNSLLSNLRTFRFQKKVSTYPSNNSLPSGNGTNGESIESSKESLSGSPVKNKLPSDELEKNSSPAVGGLKGLAITFPSVNTKVVEKCLIEAQGDFEKAKEIISRKLSPDPVPEKTTSHPANGNSVQSAPTEVTSAHKRALSEESKTKNGIKSKVKRFKRIKRASDSEPDYSGSDSENGGYKKEEKVFDSDEDSDVELTDDINKEQQEVFEFLSTATLAELLCMPNISRKKADAILEQRPFSGWRDMVEKFQETKGVSTDVLNSAQEFLYTRQVVTQLMNKCSKLSTDLERANLTGGFGSIKQPSIMSPELTLAGYQLIGLNWLIALRKRGLNGILADEMGLGKTVQIIAFLAWLKESSPHYKADGKAQLIVVPASTLDNWSNELTRWCPDLKVTMYYGSQEERRSLRTQFYSEGAKGIDVLLTTYNCLTASPAERNMFKTMKFEYVIFDEAHMLKNMKTIRYEQMSQVNAEHRILLTGTPLQNNLLELMSLLTFVMPDMFKNKKQYLQCLFTRTSTKEKGEAPPSESLPRFEQEQVAQAKKIMKPFVLRRLKKDVLKDLPKKTDSVRHCDMSPRQRLMYENLIKTYMESAQQKVEDETSGLTKVMKLRKMANHPLLVRELYTDQQIPQLARLLVADPEYKEKNIEYVKEDLAILSDFELHTLCLSYRRLNDFALSDDVIVNSGKFQALDELLPQLFKDNHRVLIFSQFVIVLNILDQYMAIRGYKHLRLDGSTPVPIRQDLIDKFNNDPSIPVFLLSTRAGGLGINLTAADTVIIHDLDFNPYNDKQAEDRCHRVGQTKPVTVYRFVSSKTIEEDIYHVAKEKLCLEKEISAKDEDAMETKNLLKKALGLGSATSPEKRTSHSSGT